MRRLPTNKLTGAKWMITSWTAVSLAGCAFGMSSTSDPESGARTVTVGAQGGGRGQAAPILDRNVVPAVGAPQSLEFPEIEDYTLGNGLRVVLVRRPALPLVSLELQFQGGASAHPASQAGLAGLAADVLDEGTPTRTALEIADQVDLLGASMSSTAGYDASQVRLSVLRSRFPEALGILADVVMRPVFPEADLERLRRERLSRVIQRSAVPAALADDAFEEVLYGADNPYGAPLLGTKATLEALTREDVVAFHRARYAPGQATLVVAGDLRQEDLDELLAQAFAGWSGTGVDARPVPVAASPTRRTIYLVDKPGAAQSEIRIGRVGVGRDTDVYFPLSVMNTVLGGSFTSRLNAKLREEKGYTYGAGSFFDLRRAPGPFEASAAVATEVTDSAVMDFVQEMDRMAAEEVPAGELRRARNYLALRLPQRFESVDDLVRRFSELVLYEIPLDFYAGYVEGVQSVDAAAVRTAAETLLGTERMAVVVAGDRSVIEEPLRALNLGPVVVFDRRPISQE
ncbi:MAG TPA: pitrilysin family protein [Longimicrobiales bacterium]|nr:pitrilysin family protein [Longimicrobiales bacterium]